MCGEEAERDCNVWGTDGGKVKGKGVTGVVNQRFEVISTQMIPIESIYRRGRMVGLQNPRNQFIDIPFNKSYLF